MSVTLVIILAVSICFITFTTIGLYIYYLLRLFVKELVDRGIFVDPYESVNPPPYYLEPMAKPSCSTGVQGG